MKVYSENFIVKQEDCISDIADYLPSILGTYTLVKWMEIVSAKNIYEEIDQERYITVGQTSSSNLKSIKMLIDKLKNIERKILDLKHVK